MKVQSVLLLLLGYMTLCYGQDVASRAVPPHCAAVLCQAPNCPNPITTGCCPICNQDCSVVFCGILDCPRSQQYTPAGECCPRCKPALDKPGRCPRAGKGHCAEICSSDRDCPRRQKCCSIGCGHDCVDPLPNKPDCSFVKCPQVRCRYGSYIPVGQCCPRCRPRSGNTGYGLRS